MPDLRESPVTARLGRDSGVFAIMALLVAAACRPDPAVEGARWAFVCPLCGKGSTNVVDAAEGYCGACRDVTGPRREAG